MGIVAIAEKENIKPPALTIVGEVVNLKEKVDWYELFPLFGKTVVITRAEEQSETFIQSLLEKGAEPYVFPVIETVAPESWDPLDGGIAQLDSYDGLIFTSANGVKFFMRRLKEKGLDVRALKGLRLYAIGPKTEETVNALGIKVDVVPEEYVAESLLKSLGQENIKGKKFLLPRASVARETLPDTLRELGAEIDVLHAYQTVLPNADTGDLIARLKAGDIDAVTFTSSSTVQNFVKLIGEDRKNLLEGVALCCIGPVTAETVKKHGLTVTVMAEEYTVPGLVTAMERYFENAD